MDRILLVNHVRELFQVKRVFWQPRTVLLVAKSVERNLETTFEFSRQRFKDLMDALTRREEMQQRGLALIIDLDEQGRGDFCSLHKVRQHGADLSISVELG